MLKSMTAFGRKSFTAECGRFLVEIQSLNRKHLEINIALPKDFLCYDALIRKWISCRVTRGQINVRIAVTTAKECTVRITPNLPLAIQYKKAWNQVLETLSLPANDAAFLTLLQQDSGVFLAEENLQEEVYEAPLKIAVEQTLELLMQMKGNEGRALGNDLSARLVTLGQWMEQITVRAPEAPKKYRQKLLEKLKEVQVSSEVDERVLKEIAIYAEKVDISEEITRFKSHLDQFAKLVEGPSESVGKTLEFLVQELQREMNTIASKSSDLEVSRLVIDCKSELERMREQIQNIE